mgnify:CR=1 FL=1|jgi:hypothetical protein
MGTGTQGAGDETTNRDANAHCAVPFADERGAAVLTPRLHLLQHAQCAFLPTLLSVSACSSQDRRRFEGLGGHRSNRGASNTCPVQYPIKNRFDIVL